MEIPAIDAVRQPFVKLRNRLRRTGDQAGPLSREVPVTAETASNTAPARLRRNVLDLPQVVFQGITHIAPSINIVFTFPIIALKAGPAMPISFLRAGGSPACSPRPAWAAPG